MISGKHIFIIDIFTIVFSCVCTIMQALAYSYSSFYALEGYEKLANARNNGLSESLPQEKSDDPYDMFGDDDGTAAANSSSNGGESDAAQPSQSGRLQNDYVYDDSSGYYYSSSRGYYYDPSLGSYCSATTGKWYSYNEESGTYNEIQHYTIQWKSDENLKEIESCQIAVDGQLNVQICKSCSATHSYVDHVE